MVAQSHEARVRRYFAGLLADMSTGDIASLLRFQEFRNRVGTLDHEKQTIFESFVPWPIILLLSRHSQKHQFTTKSLPSMAVLRTDLENCVRKIKWRYNLKDIKYEPPFKLSKQKTTPRCAVTLPPKEGQWLNNLHQCMLDACERAHSDIRGRRKSHCKTPKYIRVAFMLLKKLNIKAIGNDKGGGFTLVSAESVANIERTLFNKPMYHWEDEGSFQRYKRDLKLLVARLINKISKLEKTKFEREQLQWHLSRPLRRPDALVATLQLRIKAHKAHGEQTCRAIHANPCSTFESISRWLVAEIRGKLECIQNHIISNAKGALERIQSMEFCPGDRLIKLDMKDFYYSGSTEELIVDVLSMWDSEDKRNPLRREAMELLLHNQLVCGKHFPEEGCFRVLTGSGMGLVHSGDVADSAFHQRVERWMMLPAIVRKYEVRGYVRFKDDALLVINSCRLPQMLSTMKAKSRYFKIIIEKVATSWVNFLEFKVHAVPDQQCLRVEYAFKEMPSVPLSCTSMHNKCVHRGWPRMLVKNIWQYSSNKNEAREKVEQLKCRLASSNTQIIWPSLDSVIRPSAVRVREPQIPPVWWPISYHPLLKLHLNRALTEYNKRYAASIDEITRVLLSKPYIGVKIAWKSAAPRLEYRVR